MIDLTPQPVWFNGKLVAPKGWISPETREAMRKAQEGCHPQSVQVVYALHPLPPPILSRWIRGHLRR